MATNSLEPLGGADRAATGRTTSRAAGESRPPSRRGFLGGLSSGLAGVALASLLNQDASAEKSRAPEGRPHFPPKAKRVIWMFMRGGVSHMESFDPKPMLNRYAGKSINETPWDNVQDPEKLKRVRVVVVNDANGQQRNKLYPLQIGFQRHGQSGAAVSDWFPHLAGQVDDLAIIRSMWTTDDNHGAKFSFTPAATCWMLACPPSARGLTMAWAA